MTGLVLGEPAGIFVASWLAVKAGLATLGLAFPGTGLESQAKPGILLGFLVSPIIGIAILLTRRRGAPRGTDS